ncbi:TIM barrel protein [Thiomicrospira sp. R3]|uniref:sugar phosphate isomerase/epimerase family protein n=1 Tax=Thiomicrospira sp. R3 TaxID=3035472 RepID=UPI00259BF387|nr:TIM barrel protein [Thiomicrospira sp. R3]WFE67738.1 TIM barrel protein [Thiomicrospira sp. R3]
MRIAISNIAWDVGEDEQISELLSKYQVDAIDIAPGKYFPNPTKATVEDIANVKSYWAEKGIEITGMQSLLFGTQGLNVFGSKESQQAMLNHLSAVARIAKGLGATRLVFGSPKNRDCEGLSDEQTLSVAKDFFSRLGDIANEHGVIFCLEPNPTCYGANFMTTAQETFDVVSAINHPAIKMQLDTGAITINKESISDVLAYSLNQIGHIHISEPGLAVVGDSNADHESYARAIKAHSENPLISIEMVATQDELHLISIERALAFVTQTYWKA